VRPEPNPPPASSLFLKILLVFSATALCLLVVVATLAGLPGRHEPDAHMRAGMSLQLDAVLERIGTPPDPAKVRSFAEALGAAIRIEGPTGVVESSSLPAFSALKAEDGWADFGPGRWERPGRGRGPSTFLVQRGPWRAVFVFHGPSPLRPEEISAWKLAAALGVVLAILAAAYFTVAWVLRGVRLLVRGVEELRDGNLDYRISTPSPDEFRGLAEAFNTMAESVSANLRAKNRLLRDISHELRSPLTRVKVALELLPESEERAAIAQSAADMEGLVKELLEAERLKSAFPGLAQEEIDIPSFFNDLAKGYTRRQPGLVLRPGAVFSRSLHADPARIRRALTNLVENALKYSPEGAPPVELSYASEGPELCVRVVDRGPGIPEADLPYVFEPFYRADPSRRRDRGGYGLGLGLARGIAEAHGGTLTVRNRPGGGTEAELRLPLRSAPGA
jgi:signal transduction histidine kinase